MRINSSYVQANTTANIDQWYKVDGTFGSGGMKLYVDGDQQTDTDAHTGGWNYSAASLRMASLFGSSRYADAMLDEVRVSSDVRTAQWVWTEYNNQNAPFTFFTASNGQADS